MNYGLFGFPGAWQNSQGSQRTPFQGAQNRWGHALLITSSTTTQRVPDGVYRLGIAVAGGGANGGVSNPWDGGAGGGFAFGLFSVSPGALLLPITVGGEIGRAHV